MVSTTRLRVTNVYSCTTILSSSVPLSFSTLLFILPFSFLLSLSHFPSCFPFAVSLFSLPLSLPLQSPSYSLSRPLSQSSSRYYAPPPLSPISNQVGLSDFADPVSNATAPPVFPFRLDLVPAPGLKVDIPCDNYLTTGLANFAALPEGTTLFDVLAVSAPGEAPVSIGALVTTGNFTTSKFGDEQLFFKASFCKGYVCVCEKGRLVWGNDV